MKLHVQVSETAMVISSSEPEWQAIANLPGFQGPNRQYLLARTFHGGIIHLCVAVGPKWVATSQEEVTDADLVSFLEFTEQRESRKR